MILEDQWAAAKGHTGREPQGEKKGVRALIDAGVDTLTSTIEHLTKSGCVRREEIGGSGGREMGMKHSATTLGIQVPCVFIYLRVSVYPRTMHSRASELTQLPIKRHARTYLD